MKRFFTLAAALVLTSGVSSMAADSIHEFKVKSLEGEELNLADYKGKVLLVVNVASRCGATPQYEQLQALHEKYNDKGLVVIGFPCNQFGGQEPGTAVQIREFCSSTYSVEFPMTEKIDVNGDSESPVYSFLKKGTDDKSKIGWNFEKFIVSKDGKVAGRFKTRVKPDADEVVTLIEKELAK